MPVRLLFQSRTSSVSLPARPRARSRSFGCCSRPKWSRGNRPMRPASRPSQGRKGSKIPLRMPFRQPIIKKRRSKPEVDAGEVRLHSPTQLPSKLGQAPQARADKSRVKSASGPHSQNVRASASNATSPFWSSTSGPEQIKRYYEAGRGRRPWRGIRKTV